jgi:hypothetical protein
MSSTGTSFLPDSVGVRLIGGPTALIEMGGLRLLTDPTFDPPGDHPVGNRVLVKTRGPAVAPDGIGPVAAVLLSHAPAFARHGATGQLRLLAPGESTTT